MRTPPKTTGDDRANPHMARALTGVPRSGSTPEGASVLSGELGDAIICLLSEKERSITISQYPGYKLLAERVRKLLEAARRAYLDAEDDLIGVMSGRASDNISRMKSFMAGIGFALTADVDPRPRSELSDTAKPRNPKTRQRCAAV